MFKRLYSYLLREIFPSEDVDFSCLMIRDVGENPRDYKGDREGIPHIHPIP